MLTGTGPADIVLPTEPILVWAEPDTEPTA